MTNMVSNPWLLKRRYEFIFYEDNFLERLNNHDALIVKRELTVWIVQID